MLIRKETAADADAVWNIHRAAFDTEVEADLATALRSGGHAVAELSLVAVVDDEVVGHVVCSRGRLDGHPSLGLGPIGVEPGHQRSGVGSALMHAVLAAADALDEPLVALLGSPDYYGRFGFVPSSDVGITAPDESWGPFFQVRTLTAYDESLVGTFRYAPPFDAV